MKRIETLKAIDDALDLHIYMERTSEGIEIDFNLNLYEDGVTSSFQDNIENFVTNIIKEFTPIIDTKIIYRNKWIEDEEAGYPEDIADFWITIPDDDAGQELLRKWVEVGGQ